MNGCDRALLCLRSGEIEYFGRLMSASHASSRDDFENSSESLDTLIDVATGAPGFLGGKLSGAGWAGCTVNLVRADCAGEFSGAVATAYQKRTGIAPEIYICHADSGAFHGVLNEPVDESGEGCPRPSSSDWPGRAAAVAEPETGSRTKGRRGGAVGLADSVVTVRIDRRGIARRLGCASLVARYRRLILGCRIARRCGIGRGGLVA